MRLRNCGSPFIVASMLSCGSKPAPTDTAVMDAEPECTEPVDVECVDQLILDLALHDDKVSDADVVTEQEGDDFVTVVDASAGGYSQAASNPWVYVRFTDDGAERVDEVDHLPVAGPPR